VTIIAGYASQSLISATRTFPFLFANWSTSQSLNVPEQQISDTSVPMNNPRNSNPWINGVYNAYAAGTIVITDNTHQYQRNEYPIIAMTTTGNRNVRKNRTTESQGLGWRIPGTGRRLKNDRLLVLGMSASDETVW